MPPPPASDILSTQLELADIRTRVLAGEPVDAATFHVLLNDLRRDRESAKSASAKARREAAKATKPSTSAPLLDTLFKP